MLKNGMNLFPLEKVLGSATGYFMDATGEIWSERAKRGSLLKLTGSQTSSGRYVTLQTNSRFGQSYRYDQLQARCKMHPDFTADTVGTLPNGIKIVAKTDLATAMGLKPAVLPTVKQMTASALARHAATQAAIANTDTRHHAPTVDAGIKARGWIIGTVEEGVLTFGLKPAIHTVEGSVNAEIDRLAKLRPGKKFVKLQIQGAVTAGAVVWE